MTALLTQCPHCQTSFRVSTAQMNAAHGLVRCGSCLGVFSAGDNEIRVRTPDGYLVEEIDPDDDTEQSFSEESDDSATETAELPDEDLPLPFVAAEVIADDQEPEEYSEQEYAEEEYTEEEYANQDHHPTQDEDDDEPGVVVPAATALQPFTSDDESIFEIAPPAAPQAFAHSADNVEADEEAEFGGEHADEVHDDIHSESSHEPSPWHDEPVITLGDMRLDDVADESEDTEEVQEETHADDPLNDYIEPEPAPVAPPRYQSLPAEHLSAAAEKRNLHQHLSALADDEFDPVDDDQLDTLDSLPVTINQGSTLRGRLAQSAMLLASLLLMFALPLPWLYAKRDTLATHPRFAFMAPLACKLFTCTPAATLDLGSIYSQQLLVRSHPRYQDALEVSFIFRNDTTLPRPFPLVELAFSDLSNNLLANRLFKPEEYLPAELRQLSEMPAQSTVQVTLELQDPGKEAVNYTVKLHPPTP